MEEISIEKANKPKVESITLSNLLTRKLVVPEYQRPYVWQEEDIIKLLHQINLHSKRKENNKPLFYLGSIVLHEDKEGNFNIIDGQQRITTLIIIDFIKRGLSSGIKFDNLISQQNISSNYGYLKDRDLSLINFDEINVTIIITQSQDEAYNFFETLNTGGKRLSGIDIIKAHHLRSVDSNRINEYATTWESNQHYIEDVIKLLLKARKWNNLNSENAVPSRRSGLQDWKKIITKEFSVKTLKESTNDISYSVWKRYKNSMEQVGCEYAIRQPISDGQNFINYMVSYINLYKSLFIFRADEKRVDFEYNFNEKIINTVDGTIDLQALYQLAVFCYASRFGFDKITEVSLWIFRFVYSLRISVPNRVQETTVINHNKSNMFIDRILNAYTTEEVIDWLHKYIYKPSDENLKGVKGRYVQRAASVFQFEIPEDSIMEFDNQLVVKIHEIIKECNG